MSILKRSREPHVTTILPRTHRIPVLTLLAIGLVLACAWSLSTGAYVIDWHGLADVFARRWNPAAPEPSSSANATYLVFMNIRLPRLLFAALAGAGLGMAGALMQGLFRNPLADPGLLGVSSGAALGAAGFIVAGSSLAPWLPRDLGSWTLVIAAFAGALVAMLTVGLAARTPQGVQLPLMLLAGVAVNALAGAGLGYLSYVATDEQLRSLQFWLLGSYGGIRWHAVGMVGALVVAGVLVARRLATGLDAFALGEGLARSTGVPIERVKCTIVAVTTLVVGAVTAASGIVGFIGLVAPHLVRLTTGPTHRRVIPGAALAGAILSVLADTVARIAVSPAELPLGVLTAFVGAPFFLVLLRRWRDHP